MTTVQRKAVQCSAAMRREKVWQACSHLLSLRGTWSAHHISKAYYRHAVNLKYAAYWDLVLNHAAVKYLKALGNSGNTGFNITALQYSAVQYNIVLAVTDSLHSAAMSAVDEANTVRVDQSGRALQRSESIQLLTL